MFQKLFLTLAWLYWKANRSFTIAFAETVLGYGEGDFRVDGKKIYKRVDRFLHEVPSAVFVQFIATLATLPLYVPPLLPRSHLLRALVSFGYGLKSLVSHGKFLLLGRKKRTEIVETMYQRLIREAPEQEENMVKTIVTLSIFKWVLAMAYLEEEGVWKALGYQPVHKRAWDPPSGPNLEKPPRVDSAELLHSSRKTVRQVAAKPNGQLTYCVIGSGAGGAVAARTIQQRFPMARVILLESGPLVTGDQFQRTVLGTVSRVYMNGAITLSKDQQFMFQQGRCVGGSTCVNNSVAFKPTGFWWENLKQRWRALGIHNLDYELFHKQYDLLSQELHVSPVDDRVITGAARTTRAGWEKLIQETASSGTTQLQKPITVPSNTVSCIGCGRCNCGCQYDAKQSMMNTLIPDFVSKRGLLVPDAKALSLDLEDVSGGRRAKYRVRAVHVSTSDGDTIRVEADRFVLAAGAYASTKLLWRSGFLGAVPGVRTVGKRFSVNAGSLVVGVFRDRQDGFDGQQIAYALEVPDERMIIETAFAPPGVVAMSLPMWGMEFQRRLKQLNYMATGVPVFATLTYGEIRKGLSGDSGFVIDFSLIDEDWRRLERGMILTAKAMFEAGAEEVFINRFNARSIKSTEQIDEYFAGLGPADFVAVQSAHMQGGNVIAPVPYRGVVDENLKVYGMENAWICDASVIPSPITVNIALTVMALSRYAAIHMVEAA